MINGYQKPPSHRWDSLEDVPLTQSCFHGSTSPTELTQSSDDSSAHSTTSSSDHSDLLTQKPQVAAVEEGKELKGIINPPTTDNSSVSRRAPKAVDDDLYKIPPELLLSSKPKKKMGMGLFAMICVLPRCAF